jgi:hypothetical protein
VPKDLVKEKINTFCAGMNNQNVSAKKGESNRKATYGSGVSGGFRRLRRSPPTQFVTTSVTWTKDKGCDNFSWKIREDVCKQGLMDAMDSCDGDDSPGGTSNM